MRSSDGEDFELLLAAPADVADAIVRDQPLDCPITCVGELIAENRSLATVERWTTVAARTERMAALSGFPMVAVNRRSLNSRSQT